MSVDALHIKVLVAQFPVTLDIERNLDSILSILQHAKGEDLVILPEGALSGYAQDPAFLQDIDTQHLADSLDHLKKTAKRRSLHLVFGTCLSKAGRWYNAGVYCGPQGRQFVYHKVNLATSERGHFVAGSDLPVIELNVRGQPVKLGIQMCREIRYPEQWHYLARAGAEVFAYLTNAVGDETGSQAPVWRSHLISRAAENQRFVLSANNAAAGQKCPSMIVAPDGRVLWEVISTEVELTRCKIDLSEVSNWYLDQARLDVTDDGGTV